MQQITPASYTFWVTLLGGMIMLGINLIRRARFSLGWSGQRYAFGCGLLGSAIPTTNMFLVLQFIPAGVMALVLATTPLFTYCFALWFGNERIDPLRAAGIGLGFVGAALIVITRDKLGNVDHSAYLLLSFISPMSYAFNSVYANRFRPLNSDSLALSCQLLFAASIILLIVAWWSGPIYPIWGNLNSTTGFIVLHALCGGLGFSLFFVLIKLAGPVYFSQVSYLITLFGIGFGGFVLR